MQIFARFETSVCILKGCNLRLDSLVCMRVCFVFPTITTLFKLEATLFTSGWLLMLRKTANMSLNSLSYVRVTSKEFLLKYS